MHLLKEIIKVNAEILAGKPVFKGTRTAISTLLAYFENSSHEDFLEGFPSV